MKRAQKRAIVGATSVATAAGGIFTDREEDDSPAPADGDPSWYERSTRRSGWPSRRRNRAACLYAEAAEAKRSGVATRDHADHVQNRIRQRVEQLETHIQVDVEDVTPLDASPAQAASPVAAEPVDSPPPGAGEAPKKNGSASGLIVGHFERLGVTDRNDRLILTAQLARLDDVPSTTSKLTARRSSARCCSAAGESAAIFTHLGALLTASGSLLVLAALVAQAAEVANAPARANSPRRSSARC